MFFFGINKNNAANAVEPLPDDVLVINAEDVSEELEHDETFFTEGFFFDGEELYESSGLSNESFVYRYSDGYRKDFEDVFLEGSVVLNDKLYLLTYKDNIAYVLDKNSFDIEKQYSYDREGWGLTTDGKYLIASDGTNKIYYMDENYKNQKVLEVYEGENPVTNINELEYINGYIFANIWQTNEIVIINPKDGKVVQRVYIDLQTANDKADVMNGIAFDGEYVYLTGKYYGEIWKIGVEKLVDAGTGAKK